MSKQPEHNATNGEVKRWGLVQVATICISLSTIGAFTTMFWSSAVQAGLTDKDGKKVYASKEDVAALDAGLKEELKKMRDESAAQRLETREDMKDLKQSVDKLIEIQLKQKGGK